MSWTLVVGGIPMDFPTRVVREDLIRPGLLYAGTEFGLFVSFDAGNRWQALQLNLPRTPVTDIALTGADLVVATQGRGFWVLDDITPLREMGPSVVAREGYLYSPRPTYRTSARAGAGNWDRDRIFGATLPRSWKGDNPPEGAIIYYTLRDTARVTPNSSAKVCSATES